VRATLPESRAVSTPDALDPPTLRFEWPNQLGDVPESSEFGGEVGRV
jgi:hypothetical protein